MSKRLFGTDGIRAVAGHAPLDPPTVRRFGLALARVLEEDRCAAARVLIGRDTRESGPWLCEAIVSGLAAGGARAFDAGVITTPGLAHLVRAEGFDAGVMISASHNPFEDNGLKVFDRSGMKLSDPLEARVEDLILDGLPDPGASAVAAEGAAELVAGYLRWLEERIRPAGRFRGLRVALDCANGAASALACDVFRHHGADVVALGTRPDGRNINLACGSLHLEALGRRVVEERCDVGIAFDGDADRALAVDRTGRTVDGDHILFITARQLARSGRLRGQAVVATIMSNLWLERRLEEEGVSLRRTAVGDKYVLERLIEDDLVLGGEQSGHVIFREHATTGDGILTGLLLLDALLDEAEPLERLLDGIVPCPQVLVNVRVRSKPKLAEHAVIAPAIARIEAELGSAGRVVLRYSGTEPLARVMVEGVDREAVERHARELADLLRREIGA